MSEERLEQEERKDEDVEAHRRKKAMTDDEPRTEDEGDDDVEAHRKRQV
jgi:hypothetical protein